MRRLVAGLVLGLVLGLLLGGVIPSQAGSSPSSLNRRINKLERNVVKLSYRTSELDAGGNYTGRISGDQVSGGILCGGDPAVWSPYGDGLEC